VRSERSLVRRIAGHQATSLLFSMLVVGGVAGYGAWRGGAWASFVAAYGSPFDLAARSVGLGIDAVTISGITELKEQEILELAGITSRNSLLFLDPEAVRERLKAVPLVRDAGVRKLYPGRVAISIVERQPYALWQKDGEVSVVSVDGTVIDTMRDDRFAGLPFVVGEGANARLDDYTALLEQGGDLKSRIKAGVRVSDRRWDLVTTDGVTIRLPEVAPGEALAYAAKLARNQHILDKDIVALDLREPGRIVIQLADDAGAARLDALAHKVKGKV
jgi:cell division protein FtsQ